MKSVFTSQTKTLITSFILLSLTGCGGSSTDSNNTDTTDTTTKSLTITAVDPYISGAEFYIDLNSNRQYDAATDKLSTVGENNGEYVFENYTPESDINILAKSNGQHNGVSYKIALQGKVASGAETAILNPATTATNH